MVTRPDAGLGRDTVTGEPRQATQQQLPGLCGLVVQLQMNIREVFTITEMALVYHNTCFAYCLKSVLNGAFSVIVKP